MAKVSPLWVCAGIIGSLLSAHAQPAQHDPQAAETMVKARELEEQGKLEEALAAYLALPGAEHAAARIARRDPAAYLARALSAAAAARQPRTMLVRGDALLASGDRAGALQCYRSFSAGNARSAGAGWAAGVVPFDYYPVEPPRPEESQWHNGELLPFTVGPGSHRDNWLVRRFIALEAWPEATEELARISSLHLARASGGQHDGLGLQFAIDHAFFIKRRDDEAAARQVLTAALLKIDLDRNPNQALAGARSSATGTSRREAIRLGYGFFQTGHHEYELVGALERAIQGGSNSARRVLARVRLHEGKKSDALALEIAYLQAAGLDPLTRVYRSAMVDEELDQLAEATQQYERALALDFVPPSLPDPDEEQTEQWMMSAHMGPRSDERLTRTGFQMDVLARLTRLYASQGRAEDARSAWLHQLDANDELLAHSALVEQVAKLFREGGKAEDFKRWAEQRITKVAAPESIAIVLWSAGEKNRAKTVVLDAVRRGTQVDIGMWRERLGTLGKRARVALCEAELEADPHRVEARVELLSELGELKGAEALKHLEMLLAPDVDVGRLSHRGYRDDKGFDGPYDLAYRLMRLYERAGQPDKLVALGERIARLDRPFTMPPVDPFPNGNGPSELANACLALAIERATPAALARLTASLELSPWASARAQCKRRLAGGLTAHRGQPFGWSGLPQGLSLLASNDNVLDLARDGELLFSGHPWGVAVYGVDGTPRIRVPLATAALHLAPTKDALWVGTPIGVYRVDRKTWAVSYLPCDQHLPPEERREKDRADQNGVTALAVQGTMVWIGTRQGIRALDTNTGELRVYTEEQLGAEGYTDWTRFVFDGVDVWAEGERGCRRLDPSTGRWQAPTGPDGASAVHLLGIADGTVWGQVALGGSLGWRPCAMDRRTLRATPALVDRSSGAYVPSIHDHIQPLHLAGKHRGALVFASKSAIFSIDPAHHLVPLPESETKEIRTDFPGGSLLSAWWQRQDGVWLHGEGDHEVGVSLPGGGWVQGSQRPRSPRYIYPNEDWPLAPMAYESPEDAGGLRITSGAGKTENISSQGWSDCLPGDNVYFALADSARAWLGTERGLVVLDDTGHVTAHLARGEGLLANRVVSAARLGGRIYFGAGWGDHGGGVMVWDARTSVFTSIQRLDGLATDNVANVEAVGRSLQISYGVTYDRGKGDFRIEPPGTFEPSSARVVAGKGGGRVLDQNQAYASSRGAHAPVPFLGGFELARGKLHGKSFIAGTRGLLLFTGEQPPSQSMGPVAYHLARDLDADQRAEVKTMSFSRRPSTAELGAWLGHKNPYVVAEALAATSNAVDGKGGGAEYAGLIATVVEHPFERVRSTAIYLLTRLGGPQASAGLRRALTDSSLHVRAVAALSLAERGEALELGPIEELFSARQSLGNLPFGATSSIGLQATDERAYRAIAPRATPAVFALLMKHPPHPDAYDYQTQVFPQLGASLRSDPRSMALLLGASSDDTRRLARNVFAAAGTAVLPRLHEALTSTDRVVRANAAAGCGAIGDASSIPRLIRALDLESGLSRGCIVRALGELRAAEALPHLQRIYLDTRNDEERHSGAGFRAMQAQAVMTAHYESLGSIDALGKDWDELKAAALPKPLDPARDEPLLTSEDVLEAMSKIGPGRAQDLCRALAGDKNPQARRVAARGLGEGVASDQARNLPILQALRSDAAPGVQVAAVVSLLLLEQIAERQRVLGGLEGEAWQKELYVRELARLPKAKLDFARDALRKCTTDKALGNETKKIAKRLAE